MSEPREKLRWLPPVHECVASPPPAIVAREAGARIEREALQIALDDVREALRADAANLTTPEAVRDAVEASWGAALDALLSPPLQRVINATGVVVHTNLGRAPLSTEAIEAAVEAGGRYTPLEYDLSAGARGSRYVHAARWLRILTGADDAIVVNNNAAALLLAVDTLAAGRAVVVSRGELVEIGGGFRVHDIMAKSGARVVEVGATNKTHGEDYERAIADHDVGAIVKVHRANFAVTGFVAEVALDALCGIGRRHDVPIIFDQGTGLLEPSPLAADEPSVREALEAGAALVCASGDKLLGGPQAGLLCGRTEAIARIRENPLLRALRVDKGTLAALEATLRATADDPTRIPVVGMLGVPGETLRERAQTIVARLDGAARDRCSVAAHDGRAGGGALPGVAFPGFAVRIGPGAPTASHLERALRESDPPIIARVVEDSVWIDVRTLLDGDLEIVIAGLNRLLSG